MYFVDVAGVVTRARLMQPRPLVSCSMRASDGVRWRAPGDRSLCTPPSARWALSVWERASHDFFNCSCGSLETPTALSLSLSARALSFSFFFSLCWLSFCVSLSFSSLSPVRLSLEAFLSSLRLCVFLVVQHNHLHG